MITIKQRDNKSEWYIEVTNELWRAKDIEELKNLIEEICKLKEKYGKIK